MKTPDQAVPYLKDEKIETATKKEVPQPVLQTLKETAEKFSSLGDEAEIALHGRDVNLFRQKLEERARLLVNLPDHLSGKLEGVDPETRQRISTSITWFATSAREAITMETTFGLGVLLINKDYRVGDKNDLENLIDSLEIK